MSMEGATLPEILISLVLLSIMLLGLTAAQLTAVRESKSVFYARIAMNQANNMREYVQNSPDIQNYLVMWNQQNQEVLPQGKGEFDGSTIKVTWGGELPSTCHVNKIGTAGCILLNFQALPS